MNEIQTIQIYGRDRKINDLTVDETLEYIRKLAEELKDIELQLGKSYAKLQAHGQRADQDWLTATKFAKHIKINQLNALHRYLFVKWPEVVSPLGKSFMIVAKKNMSRSEYTKCLQEAIEKSDSLSQWIVLP